MSESDGARLYVRILRTASVMENLMANAYSDKLQPASDKMTDYLDFLNSTSSAAVSIEAERAEKVRAFLKRFRM